MICLCVGVVDVVFALCLFLFVCTCLMTCLPAVVIVVFFFDVDVVMDVMNVLVGGLVDVLFVLRVSVVFGVVVIVRVLVLVLLK